MVIDINLNNNSFEESFYNINLSIQEAFHDFEMSIILSKYAFLQENGIILEDADEAKKSSFIQKCKQFINNLVETIKRKIKELKKKASDTIKAIKEKKAKNKSDKELQKLFDKAESDLNANEAEIYDDLSSWSKVENAKLNNMVIEVDYTVEEVVKTEPVKKSWNKFGTKIKSTVDEVKKGAEKFSDDNSTSLAAI